MQSFTQGLQRLLLSAALPPVDRLPRGSGPRHRLRRQVLRSRRPHVLHLRRSPLSAPRFAPPNPWFDLISSLLFEACGRTINPVNGAVGLMWTGNWHLCQAAVETVLRGGTLSTLPGLAAEDHSDDAPPESDGLCSPPLMGFSSSAAKRWKVPAPYDAVAALSCDLDLCLTPSPGDGSEEKRSWRPATPSINSEGSVTTSGGGDGSTAEPRLLNLFV
ncbi:unnamed protein product [Musa hybrid cultivar]